MTADRVLHLHRMAPRFDLGDPDRAGASWRRSAACKGVDPAIFHPEESDGTGGTAVEEAEAEAVAICRGCPVREACLEHALAGREPEGVWGGLTAQERRRETRRRRRTA